MSDLAKLCEGLNDEVIDVDFKRIDSVNQVRPDYGIRGLLDSFLRLIGYDDLTEAREKLKIPYRDLCKK